MAAVLVIAALVGLGVVGLGARATGVARAQSAADAAALAGAAQGVDAARRVAAANKARLVAAHHDGADLVVTVEVDGHRASARAGPEGW